MKEKKHIHNYVIYNNTTKKYSIQKIQRKDKIDILFPKF